MANIAPIIPGLTDSELPQLLKTIADAGVTRVAWSLLRLPYQVAPVQVVIVEKPDFHCSLAFAVAE